MIKRLLLGCAVALLLAGCNPPYHKVGATPGSNSLLRGDGGLLVAVNGQCVQGTGGMWQATACGTPSVSVPLTTLQLQTLHSAPVVLVADPGAGKAIVVKSAILREKFGTVPMGTGTMQWRYTNNAGFQLVGSLPAPALNWNASKVNFGIAPAMAQADAVVVHHALVLTADADANTVGAINASAVGAGGSGYAATDTGTVTTGNGDATYVVDTVNGGGAVLTYHLSAPGTGYATGAGQATHHTSGGGNDAFTISVTTITPVGDSTATANVNYEVVNAP